MIPEPHCIFCKIANKEIPAFVVYEDEQFIAFLDKFPKSAGHCQIIPKEHFRWVWDIPYVDTLMKAAQKVAVAQRTAFGTEMIASQIVGDEVPHAHIWLVPQGHTKNKEGTHEEMAEWIRRSF